MKNVCEYYDGKNVQYTFEEMETNSILLFDSQEIPALQSTDIKEIPVDDEKNWQLCYGVIIPQKDEDIERLIKKMKFYRRTDFSYIKNKYECINSYYEDIVVFPKKTDEFGQIPFACLIKSNIDFSLPKVYQSYTLFLRFSDMSITSNLFKRKFVMSITDVDVNFKQDNVNHWRNYIDKKILYKK